MAPKARDPNPAPPFRVDPAALAALRRLWEAGHAAYLVGGAIRDGLLGRESDNADLATAARPEQVLALFPGGKNQNRFGTVVVGPAAAPIEITTFRKDRNYGDHRRPDEVTFTDDILEDLVRRDFTVNAIAWGREFWAAGRRRVGASSPESCAADRPYDPRWGNSFRTAQVRTETVD